MGIDVQAKRIADRVLQMGLSSPTLKRRGPRALDWQMDIQFVGQAEMRGLNAKFRKKRKTTDVLSFPSQDFYYAQGYLGELVICLPVMRGQAKQFKVDLKTELKILVVHGFLHLLNIDHERSEREAKEMLRWERKFLRKLLPKTEWSKDLGLIARSLENETRLR